jgi:virginiamycin B lyase
MYNFRILISLIQGNCMKLYRPFIKKVTIFVLIFTLLISNNSYAKATLTTYDTPSFGAGLGAITRGSDGVMWFTEQNARKIGKIAADGVVTEYPVPNNGQPFDIIQGPDGAIWFSVGGRVARTTTGSDITIFSNALTDGANYLTVGSDDAIWFTEYWNSSWSIGRIDMSGNVTHHALPGDKSRVDITVGSDGALWFIEYSNNSDAAIGRMTTSGEYSSYLVPTYASYPSGITSGPDGAIWLTETNTGKIGRLTTGGTFTEYDIPNQIHPGAGITSGPDGAIWFVSGGDYSIFRMTTTGEVTNFPTSGGAGGLTGIASDGKDSVWFVNSSYGATNSYIGRLKLDLKPAAPTGLVANTPAKSAVLTWNSVADVSSYQVFRDDVNIGSSVTTDFTDSTVGDGNHSYHVLAVSSSNVTSDPSNKINVMIDNTKPNISYSLSSSANGNGWNNTDVTVTFTCNDSLSGVQTCSSPITCSIEGANQSVSGTAVDNAGNLASVAGVVNIDKTRPTVSNPTMSNKAIVASSSETLGANAIDTVSGVAGGEYYIDTDPGLGHGTAMTYSNGKLKAATTISGLSSGQHKLYMRSKDAADNWSTSASVAFTSQAPNLLTTLQAFFSFLVKSLIGLLVSIFSLS